MKILYRIAGLSIVWLTLTLFLTGCGGGGGGVSNGVSNSQPGSGSGPTSPAPIQPDPINPNIATVIQGSIAFPTGIDNSTSNLSLSRAHFSVSRVDLGQKKRNPLASVRVELWVTRDNGDGRGQVRQLSQPLDETITNSLGEYQLKIPNSKFIELSDISNGLVNDVESLYQSDTYRLEIVMQRQQTINDEAIDKKINFSPSHNKRPIGGENRKLDLTINALIDFNNDANLSLEIANTQELEEWESNLETLAAQNPSDWNPQDWKPEQLVERLVLQENVDINSNDLLDEIAPLILFEKPVFENNLPKINKKNGKIVRIFELDVDNDGKFAESDDLVSPRLFGGDPNSEQKVSAFVDIDSDGNFNDAESVDDSDNGKPFIEFLEPLNQAEVTDNLKIRVRFCDCEGFNNNKAFGLDLGYNISSLKITFEQDVEFLKPSRFRLKRGTDIAQSYFSISNDGGTSGEAEFTLENVNFAFGLEEFEQSIIATISDFAGETQTTKVNFVINGPPQILTENEYIVSEGDSTFTTTLLIRDVDDLDINLRMLSGGDVPKWIGLSLPGNTSGITTTTLFGLKSENSIVSVNLNVKPGNDFGLEGTQVLVLEADDKNSSLIKKSIVIKPEETNTPSEFKGICWVNDRRVLPHPFSTNPQNVCTLIGTQNSQEEVMCRTNSSIPLEIPENELAKFIMCGSERDSEDEISYRFVSIEPENGATSTEPPQFNEEFFFKSPEPIDYFITPDTGSILATTFRTRSSISSFEWRPLGNAYPNQNILTFSASDRKTTDSQDMSIILSVTTVQDPPEIISVNTSGLRTGEFPGTGTYARLNFVSVEKNADFFEEYRSNIDPEILFRAQQGQPLQIDFTATDDETPTGATDPTLILIQKPDWMSAVEILPKDNYSLRIVGTPRAEDALLVQSFQIQTIDPTAKAPATTYTFKIKILDQNDLPHFNPSTSDAISSIPINQESSGAFESVTITINATEDVAMEFYIHAYDIDPTQSPYFNPDKFNFLYENNSFDRLASSPDQIEPLDHNPGKIYRSARVRWEPKSEDTNENQAAGVGKTKENQLIALVTANCPSELELIENCEQKTNQIDFRINVLSVDEPPKFGSLYRSNVQVFESDGSVHKTTTILLDEGVETEIKQMVKDEENQPITDIVVAEEDTSLINFIANQYIFKNPVSSLESFIALTGIPKVKDYVNTAEGVVGSPVCSIPLWVQPEVDYLCTPQVVTFEMEVQNSIAATGELTSNKKVFRFQVIDVADPPIFVIPESHNPATRDSNNLVNTPISSTQTPIATEDESFVLDIAVFNKVDKNPDFWDGFNFEIVQFPDPVGDMSIQSDLNNTTATTATITWNPKQEHVIGTGSKQHEIIVRACIRDPQSEDPKEIIVNSCRDQIYRINVQPKNDPPKIFFGEEKRDLTLNPITQENPFIIQEDSEFSRLIRVEDEDLQGVNLQAQIYLAASNDKVNARSSTLPGSVLVSPSETIVPLDLTPIVANPGENFVEQTVSWSSIDWDDISTTATDPQTAATYILRLVANTPDDSSSATGITETEVYLKVVSVNDRPRFTTGIIPTIIEQSDGPEILESTVIDFLSIIDNEEGDDLIITLIDKGSAVNFLTDVSENESDERTRILYLSSSPGQNGVGEHTLQVKVEEKFPDENGDTPSDIAELILKIKDSNDAPVWEQNPLFTGKFPLKEGQSREETLFIVDSDLRSNPDAEKLSFSVRGSFDETFFNSDIIFSNNQNFATTSDMSFTGVTQPPIVNSDRQPYGFNFKPLRVAQADPFAITTYYLQFTATDQFLNDECGDGEPTPCPKSAIQTIAFEITPEDDTPLITKVNSVDLPTKDIVGVCFNTADNCKNDYDYVTQQGDGVTEVTFSVTAEDQETEPLTFNFAQLGTDITTFSEVDNLALSQPLSLITSDINTPDSINLSFLPTNGNVGLELFTLKVQDTSDSSGSSRNSTRLSTRTFAMLIQNTADAPTLQSITQNSIDLTNSTTPIIIYEDSINTILIKIADLDLDIPQAFTATERIIISSTYNLATTAITSLENQLFPKEFFSYTIENITPFSGLQLLDNSNNQLLFQYASPSNISVTSTTDVIRLSWTPSNDFTWPEIQANNGNLSANNGNLSMNLLVRSFSSNSVNSQLPTSYTTDLNIRVYPVNDKPVILNQQLEDLATQDNPFSFTILGQDEEDQENLDYFFASSVPGDMVIQSGKIIWNPTNIDTITNVYNLQIYARDSGAISKISTDGLINTIPLSSEIYNLKLFLNDVDDPIVRDGTVNPLTNTLEDQLYFTQIKYEEFDYNDELRFSLHVSPDENMTIEDDDKDGEANIRWTPQLPGVYDITVKIESVNKGITRSTVFYDYKLTVDPVNDAPVFNQDPSASPPTSLVENQLYIYNIDVNDEDDPAVNLELITSDIPGKECDDPTNFVQIFASDKKLQGTTDLAGKESIERNVSGGIIETYNICIRATDGSAEAIQDFELKIVADNNSPTIQTLAVTSTYNPSLSPVILASSTLLIDDEPLIYSDPSTRKVTLYEGYTNTITMDFYDEEGDIPIDLVEVGGPGATLEPLSQNGTNATFKLTYTPGIQDLLSPPTFKLQATDNRSRQTEFVFQTQIVDTPDLPVCTFNKNLILIDEDNPQTINLDCNDTDLTSTLSFSIVTNSAITTPSDIVFNSNIGDNPNLQLQINHQGEVTFLAKESIDSDIPVTFSICGTSRNASSFETDCISVTYSYSVLKRNDEPLFQPSIPATVKRTAIEGLYSDGYGYRGGINPGLTFRFITSEDPCPPETSEEICIYDEETEYDEETGFPSDLNDNKILLSIKAPEVQPSGLRLTPYTASCYPHALGTDCIEFDSIKKYSCSTTIPACTAVSSKLTFVQTLVWNDIDFNQPSIVNLEIEAEERVDVSKAAIFNFSLQITNTNRSPYLNNRNPLLPEQINEGENFSFDLASITSEDDNDPVSYSIITGVTGMTINTSTGLINWNPNVSHIGQHLVRYGVIDQPSSGDPILFTTDHLITVLKKNNPPLIDPHLRAINDSSTIREPIATESALFEARILAQDEEGDPFSFFPSLSTLNGSPLPSDFNLTSFGTISWIPKNSNVGPNVLIVVVEDTKSGSQSSKTFELTVKNVNNSPSITNKINNIVNINEKDTFIYSFVSSDQDAGDDLSFSVNASAALSASISNQGVLQLIPNADAAGSYLLTVSVIDSLGASDSNSFSLNVAERNNPPEIEPVAEPLYVNRSSVYTFQLYASDPENDEISFSFVAKPDNVEINQSTGLLTITPLVDQTQEFQVRVEDSQGQFSAPRTVKLQFTDNQPPIITSVPNQVGRVLTPYTYEVLSNAQTFIVRLIRGPLNMLVPQNTNLVNWTPDFNKDLGIDESGVHIVEVRVQADVGGETLESDPQRYELTISKQNEVPVLEYIRDLNGNPIDTYDGTQDAASFKTILKLTDEDETDLERLDFYFADTNKSKETTANANSKTLATLSIKQDSVRLENGKAVLEIDLLWTPDNGAAMAPSQGLNNSFTIMASDGISESTSITINYNLFNVNDAPFLNVDENQGGTEIGYVDQVYTKDFFARDIDNQKVYFCLDTGAFYNPAVIDNFGKYPSLLPIDKIGENNVLNDRGILSFSGDGETIVNGNLPENHICTLGLDVPNDPSPEKGRLSKATLVWTPDDTWIERDPFPNLTLTLFDGIPGSAVANTFNLKLAPIINNMVPNIQYVGEEVAISGGGILSTPNQLNVRFIRSDGTISAVTEAYDLEIRGKGKFRVPNDASSGFISVGFSTFSSPVPFTVLNGKTTTLIGSTDEDQDLLSIPAGIASTYVDNDTALIFVTNRDYHSIHVYKNVNETSTLLGIVSGQQGNSGDIDGDNTISRLNEPTGLSLAYYKGDHYLLVADTSNHKIKAVDVSDLIDDQLYDQNWTTTTYTIANSNHLNRPYKAIQHSNPTSSSYFYIANTFGNTIELLYTDNKAFNTLSTRESSETTSTYLNVDKKVLIRIGDQDVRGSSNTYAVAGTGHARNDIFGNVFHPVDLQMIASDNNYRLLVSNYANYKYSFNSSFRLFKAEEPDRNYRNNNDIAEAYKIKDFNVDAMSLEQYGPETYYDGDVLMITSSNHNLLGTTNGMTALEVTTAVNQTDLAKLYITGPDTYYKEPNTLADDLHNDTQITTSKILDPIASRQQSLYQTYELDFSTSVVASGYVSNPKDKTARAASYIKYDTKELAITPIDEEGFYSISGAIIQTLPAEIGDNPPGEPTYYDTNRDGIADLWLPIPLLGTVYIFPGIPGTFPNAPLSFDMTNFWKFDSSAISDACLAIECLRGVSKVAFGRLIPQLRKEATTTSEAIILGDDMVLVSPFSKHYIIVEGHGWTYNGDAQNPGVWPGNSTTSLPDINFHIDRDQTQFGVDRCCTNSDCSSTLPCADATGNMPTGHTISFKNPQTSLTEISFPYNALEFTDDLNPEHVCIGTFTMHHLEQSCKFGSVDGTICQSDVNKLPEDADITLAHDITRTTTPTFEEAKNALINLEQMVLTFEATPGQKTKPLSLKIVQSGPKLKSIDLPVPSVVTPQCGEPFIRSQAFNLASLKRKDEVAVQAYSENDDDQRKKDLIFYIDQEGKFQVYDFDEDNTLSLYGEPAAKVFGDNLSQIKDKQGNLVKSTSDFLLYDVTGDKVLDLISLHPVEQKLIITKGTNSVLLLFSADNKEVQELDTLPDPVRINVVKSNPTDPLTTDHTVDIVVTNAGSSNITVFEHYNTEEEFDGRWFKRGVSFEVGDVANRFGDAVISSNNIYTGRRDDSGNAEVNSGYAVWDRYHYGSHDKKKFSHIGLASTEISTLGMIGMQSNPNKSASVLTALPLTSELIFRSTRSFVVTTDPRILKHEDLNRDGIDDLISLDPESRIMTIFYSDSSTALTYNQQPDFYPTERTGGIAFGDMDQRRDRDNVETTDIVVSNFDENSITIYFNGGVPISDETTGNFSFNHPDYQPLTIDVGRGPRGLTVADLNNDGMLDIAVANKISDNVSIIYAKSIDPVTFQAPIFYSVDNSPISVHAMPTRTHAAEDNPVLDLVTVNNQGESLSILRNKSKIGSYTKGFYKPQNVGIAEYSPSHHRTIDSFSGQIVDTKLESPFLVDTGDFGNLTSYTSTILLTHPTVSSMDSTYRSQFVSESLRYDNLVIGYRSMIYNMKNIGDKTHSAHRSAISSFTVQADASLKLDSMHSFGAESAVKSMITSGDRVYFVVSSISDRSYTLETGIEDSIHTSATMYSIPLDADLLTDLPATVSENLPYLTNFDILNEEFGSGIEAMAFASSPIKESVFAVHSGKNRGILKLDGLRTGSFQANYIVNTRRQTPTQSNDSSTVLSHNIQLLNPGGMTIDFNNLTLISIDRGNEFIRVTDLQDSVTRTMQLEDNLSPKLPNVVDITNQSDTFNYYAIGSDRKLYLINPSNSPITVETQAFDVDNPFSTSPHSSMNWFEVKSVDDYLFIGARNDDDNPTDGYIYRINLNTSPLQVDSFNFNGGLNGFDVNSSGNILYYSEYQSFQVKMVDLSSTTLSPTTLAGSLGIGGHYDGPSSIALINKPGDVILNDSETLLYFIDGSSIRSINLDDSATGEYQVATISGDPFRTGILNSDGQRALFIKPAYLHYESRSGKDILYISDELAHNIRRVEVKP